uniref:Pectin acetylesterase n=1 Tax=Aegilops tauschii subsp. strangulata TaxID=200361 RepID=A0A453PCF5_AEGTS
KNLPSLCTSKLPAGMCLFPQNEVKQIQTPLFILNAAYDSWQVRNILVPGGSDPRWRSCKHDIKQCSAKQLKILQGFRDHFLEAIEAQGDSPTRGLFINSCFAHCQSEIQEIWFAPGSPVLGDKVNTLALFSCLNFVCIQVF